MALEGYNLIGDADDDTVSMVGDSHFTPHMATREQRDRMASEYVSAMTKQLPPNSMTSSSDPFTSPYASPHASPTMSPETRRNTKIQNSPSPPVSGVLVQCTTHTRAHTREKERKREREKERTSNLHWCAPHRV